MLLLALGSNGVSWTSVTTWTLSPAYPYASSAAGQTYTFSGDPISAKGFRVVGKVNIAGNTATVKGCSHNTIVVALDKFTLPDAKYLAIEINEHHGGRQRSPQTD